MQPATDVRERFDPSAPSHVGRALAAVIALAAWLGLFLNWRGSVLQSGSLLVTTWALLRFFTITTNVLVAVVFTGAAFGNKRFGHPRVLAPVTLSILLVGIVFKLLLEGPMTPPGGPDLADTLLHRVTPVLVPLHWLLFVPKGCLRYGDPPLWMLYPLGYFAYALVRGALDNRYPYPFMDVARIGWAQTGINALVIGLGFLATSYAWVWLDHILRPRRPRSF